VLDWDTINLHIERDPSDVLIPVTPPPSEHDSQSKANDSGSEIDLKPEVKKTKSSRV
jgi:hypothetical protein